MLFVEFLFSNVASMHQLVNESEEERERALSLLSVRRSPFSLVYHLLSRPPEEAVAVLIVVLMLHFGNI